MTHTPDRERLDQTTGEKVIMSPNSDLKAIFQSLEQAYPFSEGWPQGQWPISGHFRPARFEVVVGSLLTQNTSWRNVEKALQRMILSGLVEAGAIVSHPRDLLEEVIRPSGFYRQKTRALREISNFILSFPGDFYRQVSRKQLLSLKGIGYETADSILLYSCDRPEFVVDSYTHRFLSRYGLVEMKASYQELKHFFQTRLTADLNLYQKFHALIVEHAKRTCKKRPLCHACLLRSECKSALSNELQS